MILGPIKLCIVFKRFQFGALPTEVVTKISLVILSVCDQWLLNNKRILVGPDVACHLGNNNYYKILLGVYIIKETRNYYRILSTLV